MKKQQQRNLIIAVVLAGVIGGYLVFRPSDKPVSRQTTTLGSSQAPQTFHGIPPEGSGGDPMLNRQKNRWSPPDSLKDYSIEQVVAFLHTDLDLAGKKRRDNWNTAAISQLSLYEKVGARVEGYLIAAKQTGPESCNGKSDSLRDFHIWIGASPDDTKANGLIVEMTPYYKELHPEWRLRYLQALIDRHSKVRVSGWVLWDEEHPEEVGKSRGSQWEVHPVTKFEVYSGGTWTDLQGEVAER